MRCLPRGLTPYRNKPDMPEHLRALTVILVLATAVFAFAYHSASSISEADDFTRRRSLWFALTLAAFLAHTGSGAGASSAARATARWAVLRAGPISP